MIDVAEFSVNFLALVEPNLTAVAPVKPDGHVDRPRSGRSDSACLPDWAKRKPAEQIDHLRSTYRTRPPSVSSVTTKRYW